MTYKPASQLQQSASIDLEQHEPVIGVSLNRPKPAEMLKHLARHLTSRAGKTASFDSIPPLGESGVHVGFIDNSDGANVRAEPGGKVVARLAPGTRAVLDPAHRDAAGWRYITAVAFDDTSGNAMLVRGCVPSNVVVDAPEPGALLYQVAPGDTAQEVVAKHYPRLARPGHDLRYFENVLLRINREQNRRGVQGTSASNIRLVQGERIWLPSPTYIAKLEPLVATGSYTGGKFAEAKHAYSDCRERLADVFSSMRISPAVGRQYTDFLFKNRDMVLSIFGSLLLAETLSWWAIKTKAPNVPMKVVALGIQGILLGLGIEATGESFTAAEKHGCAWLELSWHADHMAGPLAAAGEQFTHMLVQALLVISSMAFSAVKLWTMPKFTPVVAELRAGWAAGQGGIKLGPLPGDLDVGPRGAVLPVGEQGFWFRQSGQTIAQQQWAPLSGTAPALPTGIPFAFGGTGLTPSERARVPEGDSRAAELGKVGVPRFLETQIRQLSQEAPNEDLFQVPSAIPGARRLEPGPMLRSDWGAALAPADVQSAALSVGQTEVTVVGVGEVTSVAVRPGQSVMLASRNFAWCAAVSVFGTDAHGQTVLWLGHFTVLPERGTQHDNVVHFLTSLPTGFRPAQVIIQTNGVLKSPDVRHADGLPNIAPIVADRLPNVAPITVIPSLAPGESMYRNVYVTPEGMAVETFEGSSQPAGNLGALEFTPWQQATVPGARYKTRDRPHS